MKIDDMLLSTSNTLVANVVRPTAEVTPAVNAGRFEAGSETSMAAAASDSATVSAGASHLVTGSDVRLEKVTSVQGALAAGTYQVSADDLANSLMASMLQKS